MDQAGLQPEEEMNLGEGSAESEGESPAKEGVEGDEDLDAFRDFVEGLDLDSLLGNS
jgi:hypothetical protein